MTTTTLLSAAAATGASKSIGSDGLTPAHIQITGITIGTVAIQGSVDNTNWATIGTALTADALVTLTNPPPHVRVNVTVFTSGSITVKVAH
jgi:hypothetical protein